MLIAHAFLSVVMALLNLVKSVMLAQPMVLIIAGAPKIASSVATAEMASLMMQLAKHAIMAGNSMEHQAIHAQPTAPPSVPFMSAATESSSQASNATMEQTTTSKATPAALTAPG